MSKAEEKVLSDNVGYGWFSRKQAEITGIQTYKNTNNENVKITELTEKNKPISKFNDIQYVGLILKNSYQDNNMDTQIIKRQKGTIGLICEK